MKLEKLENRIMSLAGVVEFDYKGTHCGIDPINHSHYDMWYGDDFVTAKSIDEVMTITLFDKQALKDIYKNIENLDY
jgi:hypothetical protein